MGTKGGSSRWERVIFEKGYKANFYFVRRPKGTVVNASTNPFLPPSPDSSLWTLPLPLICISRPSARRRRVLSLALLLLLLRLLPVDRRAEQKRDAT